MRQREAAATVVIALVEKEIVATVFATCNKFYTGPLFAWYTCNIAVYLSSLLFS